MNNDFNDYTGNRKTHTPLFNIPPVIVTIVAICVLSFIVPEYFFSPRQYDIFYTYFSFVPDFFLSAFMKFWYTPVSYSFLHASLMHVAVNMMWLVIFGSPLANRINCLLKQKYSDCEKTRSKKSKTEKAGTENICNFRKVVTNAFFSRTFSKAFSSSLFRQRVLFSFYSCAFSDVKIFPIPAVNHFNSVTWQSPHKTALHRL